MGLLSGIGRIAKFAAPFTPWGLPASLAIGAAGGALQAGADDDPETGVLGGAVQGTIPAAAGAGLSALGSRVLGQGAAAAVPPQVPGTEYAAAAPGMAGQAVQAAAPGARGGLGSRLMEWAKANPELALQGAGTGVEAFGAYKEGQANDRLIDMREEEQNRRFGREDNMDEVLAEIMRRLTASRAG